MFAAVAGGHRVWQIPGVKLHDQGPAGGELRRDLLGQRAVGLHLVHVDAEQQLQVLGCRLQERPLIALEVDAQGAPHCRQRLVAASVQHLDEDVRVAVCLHVCPLRGMQQVGDVALRIQAEQGHELCWRRAHGSESVLLTSCGQARIAKPCVRKRASAMRSSPKPRHAV